MPVTAMPRPRIFPTLGLICLLMSAAWLIAPQSAQAGVKVGGNLRMEYSTGIYDSQATDAGAIVDVFLIDNSKSRASVSYKSANGRYQAFTELGVYSQTRNNFVQTRVAKFWWNFDGGELMFGQDFNVSHVWFPRQRLNNSASMRGYGTQYIPRNEQVRLTLGQKYKLLVALENPLKTSAWSGTGRANHYFPALAAGADLNFGRIKVKPWFRFERVDWEDNLGSDHYNSVDAGLGVKGDFGLVGFTAALSLGRNTAQGFQFVTNRPLMNGNRVEGDTEQFNFRFELRVAGLAVGYGRAQVERSDWADIAYREAAYANYLIPFGALEFLPEVLWLNMGRSETGLDRGNVVVVGLFTSVKF